MRMNLRSKRREKAHKLETNECKNLERAGDGESVPFFFPLREAVSLNFKDEEIRGNNHRNEYTAGTRRVKTTVLN